MRWLMHPRALAQLGTFEIAMLQLESASWSGKCPYLQSLQPCIDVRMASLEPRSPDVEDMLALIRLSLVLDDLLKLDEYLGLGKGLERDLRSDGELGMELVVGEGLGFLDVLERGFILAVVDIDDRFEQGLARAFRMESEIVRHSLIVALDWISRVKRYLSTPHDMPSCRRSPVSSPSSLMIVQSFEKRFG